MTTLDRLRRAGCSDEEAEAIGQAIEEDNIDLLCNCDGNCWLCPRINTCMTKAGVQAPTE